MRKVLARYALYSFVCAIVCAMLPCAGSAEPIKLKLAYTRSDQTSIYRAVIKPFIDAVNADGKGVVEIEAYTGGVLGKDLTEQAQMALQGIADITFFVSGYTPQRFPDDRVLELPGLFADTREGSLVYARLLAANALGGYEDLIVLGAFMNSGKGFHTRTPVASLADFKGLKISTSTQIASATLEKLGMQSAVLPVNLIADAISAGKIEGAEVPLWVLFQFGIGRIATHHYLLQAGANPLALVMNRQKFEGLPVEVRAIIGKYSGDWLVERYLEFAQDDGSKQLEQLRADVRREVIVPSQADIDTAQKAFNSVIAEWAAASPQNGKLLNKAKVEIARLRAVR